MCSGKFGGLFDEIKKSRKCPDIIIEHRYHFERHSCGDRSADRGGVGTAVGVWLVAVICFKHPAPSSKSIYANLT